MSPTHEFQRLRLGDLLSHADVRSGSLAFDTPVSGITDNSSKISPGTLFFAIRGSRADGHAFIPAALERGASAVVVERPELLGQFPRAVLVSSTRAALAQAAARWFGEPTRKLRLVGVTGTNGKTTSTYLLRSLWQAQGLVSGVIGTVECHIGEHREPSRLTTPDPLELQSLFARMVEARVSHAAMEVSSIALDQTRVGGCQFEVALFTNLTQDHLDYHSDFEQYYQAKRRLFAEYRPGTAIINRDDAWGQRLWNEVSGSRKVGFSLDRASEADFRIREASFSKAGTRATLMTPAGALELVIPLIGKHNLYNVLGVLAAAHALGLDLRASAQALETAKGAPGRLERVMTGEAYPHIFVDYAHTEDALLNVLRALRELRGEGRGRILTVFGCGGDRDRTKRPHMAEVASGNSDVTVATSDNPRTEDPDRILDDVERGIQCDRTRYHREVNRREAIRWALREARPEDIVLVAGKGHETYQIVGNEQFPFDDREVIRDYYRNL